MERTTWRLMFEQQVQAGLSAEGSGHDAHHALRVRNLAVDLAQAIEADVEVVEAAALLHDIGHQFGRDEHVERGVGVARDLLERSGFPPEKRAAVLDCIARHEWKPERAGDPLDPTLEYQAFAAADRLDALGAIGIARAFAFGGAHGRPIWDPEANGQSNGTNHRYGPSSVHHFHEKLLHLPGDMYTAEGQALAQHRAAALRTFLDDFHAEWNADDFADAVEERKEARYCEPSRSDR